ncbi:hypothetical protein OIO90_006661, partial [Microbotryomycetes sp. JL221]
PARAEDEADVDEATNWIEERPVTTTSNSHVDTQLETSLEDLLNEFPTSNPFEQLTRAEEVARTVDAAPDTADDPPVQLAPNVVPQGKKRSKAFTLPPKQPQPEPAPAWQFSSDGRLFKHRAQILHSAPNDIHTASAHAEVTVVIDSGSEVIAIDAAVFEQWQATLQLEWSAKASGVSFANNSSIRTAGQTRLRIRVGQSEEWVKANVFDSGGAFEVLLGR